MHPTLSDIVMQTHQQSNTPSSSATVTPLKVPPHSIEAEQSLLGGLVLENQALDTVAERIVAEDFYRHDHRLIYQAILTLAQQDSPFDVITLSDYLEKHDELIKVGGLAYLGELAKDTPSAANIGAYANIVRERAVERRLISVATEISESVYQPEGRDSTQLLDIAEQKIFDIGESHQKSGQGPKHINEILTQAVERIDELFQSDDPITGLSSGYHDLDTMTSGLQKGDLVIVAGRPSMGKTSLCMNIAETAAVSEKKSVLVFSLEMSAESLAMRMISSLGRIDQNRLRSGKLSDEDWPRITSAIGMLSEAQLFVDDGAGLTPMEIRTRARRVAKAQGGLGLIVVDYIQLMQGSGHHDNRVSEISQISRSLKSLAKELNVPVMVLSQLNRSLESRPNKRPIMSDLRESGAIEQDADLILFIYRDEVYNEDSPDKGVAEIIIGKQRNGPIGKIRLAFLGQFTRFENLSQHGYSSEAAA